jgi:hypothetical protein
MNDKEILMEKDAEQQSDARVARHSVLGAMLAVLLCILLAGIVWVCVMNTQDTDFIPVRLEAPEGYECTLSVDGVEVEGKVSDLRHLNEIVVKLSANDALYVVANFGGSASVNEAFLGLPEGVSVSRSFQAVLTVKLK